MFQEGGLQTCYIWYTQAITSVQHYCFIQYCFPFFLYLESCQRQKLSENTHFVPTPKHTSPYKTLQTKYEVT